MIGQLCCAMGDPDSPNKPGTKVDYSFNVTDATRCPVISVSPIRLEFTDKEGLAQQFTDWRYYTQGGI